MVSKPSCGSRRKFHERYERSAFGWLDIKVPILIGAVVALLAATSTSFRRSAEYAKTLAVPCKHAKRHNYFEGKLHRLYTDRSA
jgi:hypothetical protein